MARPSAATVDQSGLRMHKVKLCGMRKFQNDDGNAAGEKIRRKIAMRVLFWWYLFIDEVLDFS